MACTVLRFRIPLSRDSILCEAYALEKEDPSFLDRLTSIVLEKKAAETTWLHDDAAARNLAIQASLHPKLLEWSLVLRAASPYCELMRSLAPSDLLVRDHHLDDSIVAVLGDGERTLSQADLLSV